MPSNSWISPLPDPPDFDLSTAFSPTAWRQSLGPTILLTTASHLAVYLYFTRVRRYPNYAALPPSVFTRSRPLYGFVPRVGDGDNFRFFHTPCGRLLGWGWLRPVPPVAVPGRRGKSVVESTLHIRIAGVDAPECAHFGREAQWHGDASLEWLQQRLLGKYVKVRLRRRDQYDRVVGSVWVRRWWGGWRDLGLEMVENGMACVYEGSYGAEFGDMEMQYRDAEKRAKEAGLGMWGQLGKKGLGGEEMSPAKHKREQAAKVDEAMKLAAMIEEAQKKAIIEEAMSIAAIGEKPKRRARANAGGGT